MSWLRTLWEELVGLFVDDVGFAIGIVAWLAAAYGLFHLALVPPAWRGVLLFLGLAGLFVESTLRRARKLSKVSRPSGPPSDPAPGSPARRRDGRARPR